MMRSIRSIAALAGLVPVLALTGSTAPALARPAFAGVAGSPHTVRPAVSLTTSGFRVAARRHYGEPGNASGFSVIVVSGRHQAWAFGGTNPGGTSTPVAERWNGSTVTPSALPAGLTGFINYASAPSAHDIWAASEFGQYVLHWNGAGWHLARRWSSGPITGLTAISPTDVWVFGTTASGVTGTGTWHLDGHQWVRVAGRAAGIYRASAVSRRDIWAISATSKADSILTYNGRSWRRVHTGSVLSGVQLHDILAVSDHDVWVLGDEVSRGRVGLVLAHWNGARWATLSRLSAWPGLLARGPHGSVLVTATPSNAAAAGLILQAGEYGWGPVITIESQLGSGVSDVALVGKTRSLWATGGVLTRLGGDAVIWQGTLGRTAHHRDDDDV
ncbi:MAG: hypothetical protein WAK71_06260 [Streptosporangiaceae bacterium]